MAQSVPLKVELVGEEIIVSLPDTNFTVGYRKSSDWPWLVATSDIRDDQDAPISLNEFVALAWTAVNDKARELGWIV